MKDVFHFNSKAGWKEASGEDDKAGWVKYVPVDQVPKDFKVGSRGLKVFIEYLG